MKKILVVLVAAMMVMAFTACAQQAAPEASAGMANPWTTAADAGEVKEKTGVAMSPLPEGAENASYSFMESDKIAQAVFTWKGDEYTYRQAPGTPEGDISGMFVDFKNTEELKMGDYPYTIRYNEGAEGASRWHDQMTDSEYSVTMSSGATKEKLSAISEALIPAD